MRFSRLRFSWNWNETLKTRWSEEMGFEIVALEKMTEL